MRVGSFALLWTGGHGIRDETQKQEGLAPLIFPLHGCHRPHDYVGCLLTAGVSTKNRWKL